MVISQSISTVKVLWDGIVIRELRDVSILVVKMYVAGWTPCRINTMSYSSRKSDRFTY